MSKYTQIVLACPYCGFDGAEYIKANPIRTYQIFSVWGCKDRPRDWKYFLECPSCARSSYSEMTGNGKYLESVVDGADDA